MPVSVQVGSRSLFCPTAATAVEVQSQPVGGEDANPEFSVDLWFQRLVRAEANTIEEPGARKPHAGICEGGVG